MEIARLDKSTYNIVCSNPYSFVIGANVRKQMLAQGSQIYQICD